MKKTDKYYKLIYKFVICDNKRSVSGKKIEQE